MASCKHAHPVYCDRRHKTKMCANVGPVRFVKPCAPAACSACRPSCHHCTARGRCSQGRAPYINTIILPSLMANLSMPCAAAAAANGAQTSTHLAGGMET